MAGPGKDQLDHFEKVLVISAPNNKKPLNAQCMRAHVANMTTNKPGDPVVVSLCGVALRMSDVQLLQGPCSINESIIGFYYSYLENERHRNSDIAFIAPETTNCLVDIDAADMEPLVASLCLNEKQFVFLVFVDNSHVEKANCQAASHFTLVVFSRPEKTYFYYESCSGSHKSVSKKTKDFVQELSVLLNCSRWNMKPIRGSALLNTGYDCGIRVVCMTDIVADYLNRYECIEGVGPLHQDTVSAKRTELLKLIYAIAEKTPSKRK